MVVGWACAANNPELESTHGLRLKGKCPGGVIVDGNKKLSRININLDEIGDDVERSLHVMRNNNLETISLQGIKEEVTLLGTVEVQDNPNLATVVGITAPGAAGGAAGPAATAAANMVCAFLFTAGHFPAPTDFNKLGTADAALLQWSTSGTVLSFTLDASGAANDRLRVIVATTISKSVKLVATAEASNHGAHISNLLVFDAYLDVRTQSTASNPDPNRSMKETSPPSSMPPFR